MVANPPANVNAEIRFDRWFRQHSPVTVEYLQRLAGGIVTVQRADLEDLQAIKAAD